MNTKTWLEVVGLLLAGCGAGLAQPVILTQVQNQTNVLGTTAMFSLIVTGAPPLTYQWRSYANASIFTNIASATNATLLLTNVQPSSRRFGVEVCDASGLCVTSALATLTVYVPPTITSEPTNETVEVGETVTFRVAATSVTQPLAYQWHFNGAPLSGHTATNLVLANVPHSAAGTYFAVVTNRGGTATSQVATLTVAPALFTKITTGPVVTDSADSRGGAWGDYDEDGDLDLFVSTRNFQGNRLYRNDGSGSFSRVTVGNPVATSSANSDGGIWGDFDNDGHLDLFVPNQGQAGLLFRGLGRGDFTHTAGGELASVSGVQMGATWGDYDADGFIDLFVPHWEEPSNLYRNNRAGGFTRVRTGLLINRPARSFGCKSVDTDDDGAADLFVSNGNGALSFLYRNRGDGALEDVTPFESWLIAGGASATHCWGDYNNDGFLDLFSVNVSGMRNELYFGNGDGTYTKTITGHLVTSANQNSRSCATADFDNDGWLDLFVGNGESTPENNYLYRNNGDGTFTQVGTGAIVRDGGSSWGAAWGDYDRDGFLDLFVANVNGQNDALYRNIGGTNAWLHLKLHGTVSNRSAIGAKVRLLATIDGTSRWQRRDVTGGDAYTGQDSLDVEFGLGNATNADRVRIEWPSGVLQELTNVSVRQFLNVTETVPAQITLWQQPQSRTAPAGATVKLFVQASGPPPLQFAWQRNGVALPGATNRLLFLTSVQPADAGSYRVIVSSTNQSVASDAALLTVEPVTGVPHRFDQISVGSVASIGAARLELRGKPSYPNFDIFPVEATTNFSDWTPLSWQSSSNGAVALTDAQAARLDRRFYRTPANSFLTPFHKPTGSYPVGAQDRQFIDSGRSNKRIMTTFYYPAELAAGSRPMEYIDRRLGLLHSARGFAISNNLFAGLHAHAVTNAAIAPSAQPHPVLLFSHGFTDARAFSPPRCSELASHGYIVVSIDHVDAFGTIFADGTLVTGIAEDTPFRSQERDKDLQFIMDALATLNAGDPLFGSRLDLNRMGALGFSYGGSTAMEVCKLDSRCKAAANLDGDFVTAGNNYAAFLLQSPMNKPAMILQQEGTRPDFTNFFNLQPRDVYVVSIKGVIHGNFGAATLLPHVPYGTLDNRRATQLIDACLVSFFNKHLKGDDDHLLDNPTERFPEVSSFQRK